MNLVSPTPQEQCTSKMSRPTFLYLYLVLILTFICITTHNLSLLAGVILCLHLPSPSPVWSYI